jgi:hypothetical protein
MAVSSVGNTQLAALMQAAGIDPNAVSDESASTETGSPTGVSAGQASQNTKVDGLTGDATSSQAAIANKMLAAQEQQFATQQAYNLASSKLVMQNEMLNGLFKQIRESGRNGKDAMSA